MGYKEAPWTFKGRAIYQLQLIKSEEARKYIPDSFKLVELFGYTLGGFYLARYDHSPAGAFDELVALAGLVWNAPTSCAWAGRVYVNNRQARNHGIRHVGLPSRLANFSASPCPGADSADKGSSSWWHWTRCNTPGDLQVAIKNTDSTHSHGLRLPVVTIQLPQMRRDAALGPRITLPLPSFSGATKEHPGLLRYACQLQTNVLPVAPLSLEVPWARKDGRSSSSSSGSGGSSGQQEQHCEDISGILGGRPLVALAFNDMVMTVNEPEQLILQVPAALKK